MPLSTIFLIILIVLILTISMIFFTLCAKQLIDEYHQRYNRRAIAPLNRVIRLHYLRHQIHEIQMRRHYEQQQKVNEQLRNSVIVINADNTMGIAFSN